MPSVRDAGSARYALHAMKVYLLVRNNLDRATLPNLHKRDGQTQQVLGSGRGERGGRAWWDFTPTQEYVVPRSIPMLVTGGVSSAAAPSMVVLRRDSRSRTRKTPFLLSFGIVSNSTAPGGCSATAQVVQSSSSVHQIPRQIHHKRYPLNPWPHLSDVGLGGRG